METPMNDAKPRIAGAGICCLDHFVVAPSIPYGSGAHVTDYLAQGGGLVATAIAAAARLGADCGLFSLLGDDPTGDQIISELESEGVSTDGVVRFDGGRSPFSFIHVDDVTGERTIFHRDGAGLDWRPDLSDFSSIARADALLVDHSYPPLAIAAASVAREHGVPVVADVMLHRSPELMKLVDVLIAPRHLAHMLGLENDLNAALDAIHDMGPGVAVITLGSDGWVYSDPSGKGRGEAFMVDVVDTTGAGDVFHGAFAYGMATGWDTRKSCEFAAAVAAIKCTKRGGRTGIPSLEEAMEFLRKGGRES